MADLDGGSTTVGSITGYLKLNKDDWDAKLEEAKAEADELGRTREDIRVDADITEALAQLAALREAVAALNEEKAHISVSADEVPDVATAEPGPAVETSAVDSASVDAAAAAEADLADATAATTGAVLAQSVAFDGDADSMQAQVWASDAVVAAEAKMSAAIDAESLASLRLLSARTKQAEQLDSENVSLSTFQGTLARVMSAEQAEAKASDDVTAAKRDLTAAVIEAQDALDGLENAENKVAAVDVQGGNSVGFYGALGVGIAGVVSVLPELIEYAAAVGGGFTAMGVTGVLAFEGIKKAEADGSQEGQEFAAAIVGLKSEFDALSATAALDVLTAFQKAEQEIVGDMPALNANVAVFAGLLGQSGDNLVDAAVKGLETLDPLLIDGAQYLERLSQSADNFAGSTEFAQFVTAAREELPQVEQFVDSTGSALVRMGTAIAPVGEEVLTLLNDLAGLINNTPVPVLTAIAGTAGAVAAGFLAWKAIYPLITQVDAAVDLLSGSNVGLVTTTYAAADAEDTAAASSIAMGSALDFALGPVGLVLAGAGALTAVLLGASSASSSAAGATDEYTEALRQDNGALGENVKAQAAKALSDAGAFEAAKSLGISQATLTQAVLGNASAQKTVTAAIQENGSTVVEQTNRFGTATGKITEYSSAADKVRGVVDSQSSALKSNVQQYKDQAAAMGTSASSAPAAVSATNAVSAALAKETAATTTATNALTLMNGGSLSLLQAQTAQAAAINSATSSFQTNKTAINGNSTAAVANQQAIQSVVSAVQANAQATLTATGSQDKATQAAMSGKAALIAQLTAQHELTPAVLAYINSIKWVPTSWTTKMIADKTQAQALAAEYKGFLATIPSDITTTVTANVANARAAVQSLLADEAAANAAGAASPVRTAPGSKGAPHAGGGLINGPGNSFTDSAGLFPLSNGEFVVSNEAGQVDKNRGILEAMNSGRTPSMAVPLVSGSGGGDTHVHVQAINKTGVGNLSDYVDLKINGALVNLGTRTRYAQIGRRTRA